MLFESGSPSETPAFARVPASSGDAVLPARRSARTPVLSDASANNSLQPAIPERLSIPAGLYEIYASLSRPRRREFFGVILLMLVGAIAELATIGAVIPLIKLLVKPDRGHDLLLSLLPLPQAGNSRLVAATAMFTLFAVSAGLARFQLASSARRFIFRLGHDIIVEIQRRVLAQPLAFHMHRNTSELLAAIDKSELLVHGMLLPLMHAFTGGVIASFIVLLLVGIDPVSTLSVLACLLLTYGFLLALFRRRLTCNSHVQKSAFDERLQVVQESLGGIRELIVDGAQAAYLDEFRRVDSRLAAARSSTQVIQLTPHYLVETVAMIVIAAVGVVLAARGSGIAAALPILGTLAIGAQRLLPLVQDVYRGWSAVDGHRSTLDQVVELMRLAPGQSRGSREPLSLVRSIKLDQVSLAYPTRSVPALDNICLTIPRGSIVALVGPTGSGKSTLLDVLSGLLPPTRGHLLIDGKRLTSATRQQWYPRVALVPQSIFLADASIGRNIALSLPDQPPDHARIVAAAKKAQLHDFILSLPAGYDTCVGERGIRLSGGQRQRLGLARAIYKEAPLLILDEATSAVDEATEAAVIDGLREQRRKGKTIIIVSHRLSVIRNCDLVVKLDRGAITKLGTFEQVFECNPTPV